MAVQHFAPMGGWGWLPQLNITWTPNSSPSIPISKPILAVAQLEEFPFFSKLPPELRVRIWRFAAPSQRVIEIRSWGDQVLRPYKPVKFTANPHRPPTILQVNQESRQEGLRLYQLVKLGVSAAIIHPDRRYVNWDTHPRNPNIMIYRSIFNPATSNVRWEHNDANPHRVPRRLSYLRNTEPEVDMAWPDEPRGIYIDFTCDIIYLGPEFHRQHLKMFLATTGTGHELSGLQYLAMKQDLWRDEAIVARQNTVREALYALHTRPLKEIYIIPDDVRHRLPDRFYYGKHEIQIEEAPYTYSFWFGDDQNTPREKTVVQGFQEWFGRLWGAKGLKPPTVEFKSLRRGGLEMAEGQFKMRIWDFQDLFTDMSKWQNWNPS